MISIWVTLTILLPATLNNYILNKYQVPEALQAMLEQRNGYHEKWDLNKNATMDDFFKAYPQFKNYSVPENRFSWIWYYGMQYMGDLEAHNTSTKMTDKILMRNKISEQVAFFVPTIHAELSFNKLAGTDMISHLNFLDALTNFHNELRLQFYPKIFDNISAKSINWEDYHIKYFESKRNFNWFSILLPTVVITLLFGILGIQNLKRL